eukprot:TRINITY_DN20902_c0_g1_i2.p1 TRINITY_DN20902_c0_g1~~TRINITY_DN20902_c0_g1_i2.p1  ORF type:complete len:175 (+),score=52.75 TRINITY_DN20902_c0_g1_i2:86-610(+)
MGNCCNRDDHPQEEELPPRRRYGRPCRQGQRHEMYPLADGSVLTVGSAGTYNGPSPDTDEWEHEDWDDAEDAEARYRREQEEERREFELVKQRTEALLARSRRRLAAKEEEFRRLTDAGDNSSVSSTRRGSLDQRGAWDLDAVQKCIASSAECSVGEAPLHGAPPTAWQRAPRP